MDERTPTQTTNEALAAAAKVGDRDALLALWERNQGLLIRLLHRLYKAKMGRVQFAGATLEDVEQLAYICLDYAVKNCRPAAGAFNTCVGYAVKGIFYQEMQMATKKQREAPLTNAQSLDEIIEGMDGISLVDTIEDGSAGLAFEQVEESLFREKLHEDLEKALSAMPMHCADVIRAKYYKGHTLASISTEYGLTLKQARQIERQAIQKLRASPTLCSYLNEHISAKAYHGTGLTAWRGGGSIEERLTERRETQRSR